ncbi:unnamed protein product [Nippostrongylus brasiliensis]|uniref:Uncharacterized protein n=1 Tax=Nippostrongylus brasiliensis TaxID=27835 RepID=A0A0N4YM17_NIPBR|nr:unnamed protein product [Nippostrongylus brasiliensis]
MIMRVREEDEVVLPSRERRPDCPTVGLAPWTTLPYQEGTTASLCIQVGRIHDATTYDTSSQSSRTSFPREGRCRGFTARIHNHALLAWPPDKNDPPTLQVAVVSVSAVPPAMGVLFLLLILCS